MASRSAGFWLLVAWACAGCAAQGGSLFKPRLDRVSVGMTKDQVIAQLGRPGEVAASDNVEYLKYGWDDPADGRIAVAQWYFVRLVNGRVQGYGRVGDMGSTPPSSTLNVNIR
jgi:hypothetical protein